MDYPIFFSGNVYVVKRITPLLREIRYNKRID